MAGGFGGFLGVSFGGFLIIVDALPPRLFGTDHRRLSGLRAAGILQRSHARVVGREIDVDDRRDDDGGAKNGCGRW